MSINGAIEECKDVHENRGAAPNNDFCFDEEDVIQFRNNANDATRHQGIYTQAWEEIKALEGTVVQCKSSKDGTVDWTVVEKLTDGEFTEVRIHEEELFHKKYFSSVNDSGVTDEGNYNDIFCDLWPNQIDNDISKINAAILKENAVRKSRFQRPIRSITKAGYIT